MKYLSRWKNASPFRAGRIPTVCLGGKRMPCRLWLDFLRSLLLIAMLVLINSLSVAHLCHDPFRPREHLVLYPEKDLISIEEEGEFRIYIENTFSSTLRNVQLFVENPALETRVEPTVLKNLSPGERAFFLIKLKLKKGFDSGNYPLRISVEAKSAELKPSIERMGVTIVEKKKLEQETEQERAPFKEEPAPVEEPVPVKEGTPVEEKTLKPLREEIEVSPEKKPVPPPAEEVAKPVEEKVEPQQEVGEVVVKVEKIPFWQKPYFYIILILVLVAILIWRKIK